MTSANSLRKLKPSASACQIPDVHACRRRFGRGGARVLAPVRPCPSATAAPALPASCRQPSRRDARHRSAMAARARFGVDRCGGFRHSRGNSDVRRLHLAARDDMRITAGSLAAGGTPIAHPPPRSRSPGERPPRGRSRARPRLEEDGDARYHRRPAADLDGRVARGRRPGGVRSVPSTGAAPRRRARGRPVITAGAPPRGVDRAEPSPAAAEDRPGRRPLPLLLPLAGIVAAAASLRVLAPRRRGALERRGLLLVVVAAVAGRALGRAGRAETNPPLYYTLQHLCLAFGDSEAALRSLAAVFGVLAVPLGRHLTFER